MMLASKAYIAMMDILAHNNWERPIYYVATTSPDEAFLGLNKYLQSEGLVYRLVPIAFDDESPISFAVGGINTSVLYDRLMNKYDYSQYADKNIFLSEDYTRMTANIKIFFLRLSEALVKENKMDSAINALNKCYSWLPSYTTPYSGLDTYLAYVYLTTGTEKGVEKGVELYHGIIDQLLLENTYYRKFKGNKTEYVSRDLSMNMGALNEVNQRCRYIARFLDKDLAKILEPIIEKTNPYAANNMQMPE